MQLFENGLVFGCKCSRSPCSRFNGKTAVYLAAYFAHSSMFCRATLAARPDRPVRWSRGGARRGNMGGGGSIWPSNTYPTPFVSVCTYLQSMLVQQPKAQQSNDQRPGWATRFVSRCVGSMNHSPGTSFVFLRHRSIMSVQQVSISIATASEGRLGV